MGGVEPAMIRLNLKVKILIYRRDFLWYIQGVFYFYFYFFISLLSGPGYCGPGAAGEQKTFIKMS